jgi:hypothetical protein
MKKFEDRSKLYITQKNKGGESPTLDHIALNRVAFYCGQVGIFVEGMHKINHDSAIATIHFNTITDINRLYRIPQTDFKMHRVFKSGTLRVGKYRAFVKNTTNNLLGLIAKKYPDRKINVSVVGEGRNLKAVQKDVIDMICETADYLKITTIDFVPQKQPHEFELHFHYTILSPKLFFMVFWLETPDESFQL